MTREEIKKKYKTGDSFKCKIQGHDIEGKILIEETRSLEVRVYLCHDHSTRGHGGKGSSTLEYRYSWSYDSNVTDLVIIPAKKPEEIINSYSIF